MLLKNHIVKRLLTDDNMWAEMCIVLSQQDGNDLLRDVSHADKYAGFYSMLHAKDNKNYFITKSVMDKLHLFDAKKSMELEGWKIFEELPDFKKTFILPTGNTCIRVQKAHGALHICHIDFSLLPKDQRTPDTDGNLYWILLFVDFQENRIAEHFMSEDGKKIAPLVYSILCFTELCDNETILVEPGRKYGTRKEGKIINNLPANITVINNTWNVITVRTEGFPVSGHAAWRWAGSGGNKHRRLVYIEPYMKSGYTRRSGKELSGQ